MIESNDVLGLMKVVYVIYLAIVFSMVGIFAFSLSRPYKVQPRFRVPFYAWLGFLVCTGVGIHVLTFNTIPWVKWDLARDTVKTDKEFNIRVADYHFNLPEKKLVIQKGQMVRFKLESLDYTYGFGLFRNDGTMVFQMQVLPGRANDVVWKFDKPDTYTIRSTEYSGPRGGSMVIADAVEVGADIAVAQAGSTAPIYQ